jgi:hypothetical protein
MGERDYSAQNNALIEKETRKFERAKEKAEALEDSATKTMAALLKQQSVKRILAKDAHDATKDRGRRAEIFKIAAEGAYNQDQDVVTGDEPRPWED